MPKYDSPHWDRTVGVCTKHLLPEIPCRSCLIDHDPDVEIKLTATDILEIYSEPGLSPGDFFLVADRDWALERLVL